MNPALMYGSWILVVYLLGSMILVVAMWILNPDCCPAWILDPGLSWDVSLPICMHAHVCVLCVCVCEVRVCE